MTFPKAYIITLPENQLRTERCRQHLTEVGMPEFRFFNGIDATTSGIETSHPYEVDAPGSGFNMGPKPVGIWLSHYMLWSALQFESGTHFHIMESDAKYEAGWRERFDKALADVPDDFDMIYTGSCCCAGHPMDHVAGDVYRMHSGSGPQCLHSYVVAKKALPTLLSTQRKIYAPIDISLVFHTHKYLKVYVVLPRIADQFDTEFPP